MKSSSSFALLLCLVLLIGPSSAGRQQPKRRSSGSTDAGDRCKPLSDAISIGCDFTYNDTINALQWTSNCAKKDSTRACQPCPINGGVGDVTRIETTNYGQSTSDNLCVGCVLGEVLDTSITFCRIDTSAGKLCCAKGFGPCNGVNVYRCSCQLSALPALPALPVPSTIPYIR